MPKRVKLPCINRVRRQLDDLEWLLVETGCDIGRWTAKLSFSQEEGLAAAELILTHKGKKIRIYSSLDPERDSAFGIGQHHFIIDGNHWYDEFAVGTLRDTLGLSPSEKQVLRLCDLAVQAAERVGRPGDVEELLKAVEKVRKST